MKKLKLLSKYEALSGKIYCRNCNLLQNEYIQPFGKNMFVFEKKQEIELEAEVSSVRYGSGAPSLHFDIERKPFGFRIHDINDSFPLFIPGYEIIVIPSGDKRSYRQVEDDISEKGLNKIEDQIQNESEESFLNAAEENLEQHCPALLGVGRNMCVFMVDYKQKVHDLGGVVEPRFAGTKVELAENDNKPVHYNYFVGRGISCKKDYTRCLEKGYLPILRTNVFDADVVYEIQNFACLEKKALKRGNVDGTFFLVADNYGKGRMLTKDQVKQVKKLLKDEKKDEEEVLLCTIITVTNNGSVPNYAWLKSPVPSFCDQYKGTDDLYYFEHGLSKYSKDRVFAVTLIEGEELSQEEAAVLLQPQESIEIQLIIPHRPISEERAQNLKNIDVKKKKEECIEYWEGRLLEASKITVPEKRIENMVKAGLIHIDISTYGNEPEGTLSPTIGVYSALGSESWPIILFFLSVGLNDTAKRCIQYFYDKQHEDGFMQNFGNYMLETGAILWVTAEYYKYTNDVQWLESVSENIVRAVEYILAWRNSNKKEELYGKGYGLLDGQAADQKDQAYRIYLLNAITYKGLNAISEIMSSYGDEYWTSVRTEIDNYKNDIRISVYENFINGISVPLGDATWCPTSAPWAGGSGPVSLYSEDKRWYTHGHFTARDSHLIWLLFAEIFSEDELYSNFLLHYHSQIFFIKNVRTSQPYYSRHPYIHLKRGEPKLFLKAYYNTFSALADRETFSFWEHFHHVSAHKTHEEACFLIETIHMLCFSDGSVLKLFHGIPSRWLENENKIILTNFHTALASFCAELQSSEHEKKISLWLRIVKDRGVKTIIARIPHPNKKVPVDISGADRLCNDYYKIEIGSRLKEYKIRLQF